ncbi:MAG: sulfur carrier protein ThiS [Myxococcota bacterium]
MTVKVNGESRTLDAGATVEELLEQLKLADRRSGLAVAVNRRVVPRSEYGSTPLPEGAEVEILRAVGGG